MLNISDLIQLHLNQYLAGGYHEMNSFYVWAETVVLVSGDQSTWTFILNQSENQRSMKNLQIVSFLFLLHHCMCQNYTQTRQLLEEGKLVLHYGVQDQQFKFKLVGKADEQIGLAFSYDVSDWMPVSNERWGARCHLYNFRIPLVMGSYQWMAGRLWWTSDWADWQVSNDKY